MTISEYEIQKIIAEKYGVDACDVVLKAITKVFGTPVYGKEYHAEIFAVILNEEDE